MLLARAVRLPSLLLVFCQVKQERRYAYSTTSFVSQSVRQEKIDNFAFLPRAREARTRGRVIGVSVGCLFVCLFVDTKTSSLSETGQIMSSTYYVPVRNRKILASTYLTNESVRQGAEKSRLKIFFALLKLLFNIVDPCQKNDYYQSGRS